MSAYRGQYHSKIGIDFTQIIWELSQSDTFLTFVYDLGFIYNYHTFRNVIEPSTFCMD